MPGIMNSTLASLFDETSTKLRGVLDELEGVSPETLENLDHIAYPRQDTPPPHDEEASTVYVRLVLLALAEAELHRQGQAGTREKAAKRS